MNNRTRAKILSPLLFFLMHVIYLVVWSPDPFLKKWIDGSFTFFVALVLCNVIRARTVAAQEDAEDDDAAGVADIQGGETKDKDTDASL